MEFISRIQSHIPRYVWVMLSVGWMIMIFVLSSRQSVKVSEEYWANFLFFKTLHVLEYAVLMVLNTLAFVKNIHTIPTRKATFYASVCAILYAVSDEIHQLYVPTRSGKYQDVLIDSIGIFSVYCLILLYEKNKKRPSTSLHPRTS